jgi:hypothetical protein
MYRRLESVEKGLDGSGKDLSAALSELDDLEAESAKLSVPGAQRTAFFEFRQNLHDVRGRLEERRE